MSAIENEHLGKTLGRAHDTDRANSLIRGNKNESLHRMPVRGFNDITRADHIVRDRLFCIRFHQRDMLVCSRVKDNLGLMKLEHLLDAVFIAHIRNHRLNGELWEIFGKLKKRLENTIFTMAKQDELRRRPARHLATDLTPDRTTRASDQDAFPAECPADQMIVDLHRLATQ